MYTRQTLGLHDILFGEISGTRHMSNSDHPAH
jgi:hypothetical protein